MTAVKVGDRVRVTCGESVIVGTVGFTYADEDGIAVSVDWAECEYFCSRAWTVELLPPPIPDVEGTIVRDRNGTPWLREAKYWTSVPYGPYLLAELERACGPLTVLWTPEVTS